MTVVQGELCDDTSPPARGSTPVGTILLCVRLVIHAGVSLRAVPRILALFLGALNARTSLPEASSIRSWLLRLSLFALTEKLEHGDDWAYIIDHTLQLGDTKACVILGFQLRHSPLPSRPLRFNDLQPLAVIPVTQSNGEIVAAQLENVAKRTGIPRLILSDGGSDLRRGGALFQVQHASVRLANDAAHHGANLLKRRLENDTAWSEYVSRLGQVKARVQQTSDAYMLAPTLRAKARYMNLHRLLKWSRCILTLLDRCDLREQLRERLEHRYGWLREYRAAIACWWRWESTAQAAVSFLRVQGYYMNCESDLNNHLLALTPESRDHDLATEFCIFAREQSAGARPGERWPASSEIEESLFGKWKTMIGQQSQSGISSMILGLGTLVGEWTIERVQAALEATPIKHVTAWVKEFLPASLQSQRRELLALGVNESCPITADAQEQV